MYMTHNDKMSYNKAKERGIKRKLMLIEMLGGKCCSCGYDNNISALEFHHVDPNEKILKLDMRHMSNSSEESLINEAKKCILLCSNCHKEVHHPSLDKKNIDTYISEINAEHEEIKYKKEYGSVCPVCGKRFPKVRNKKYCSKECRIKAESKIDDAIVINKYNELKSQSKTAEFFNVSRKVVRTILKRNNLAK